MTDEEFRALVLEAFKVQPTGDYHYPIAPNQLRHLVAKAVEQEQKQKPATVEWLLKWYMACDYRPLSNVWHYYCAGWRHAERFHGIRKEDGK
jgi:hypothetical protein